MWLRISYPGIPLYFLPFFPYFRILVHYYDGTVTTYLLWLPNRWRDCLGNYHFLHMSWCIWCDERGFFLHWLPPHFQVHVGIGRAQVETKGHKGTGETDPVDQRDSNRQIWSVQVRVIYVLGPPWKAVNNHITCLGRYDMIYSIYGGFHDLWINCAPWISLQNQRFGCFRPLIVTDLNCFVLLHKRVIPLLLACAFEWINSPAYHINTWWLPDRIGIYLIVNNDPLAILNPHN